MYVPRHFEESSVEVMHALIGRHPLGTLIAMTPRGLEASHVPFLVEPSPADAASQSRYGTLRCHVARANPLWRALSSQAEVLTIFQGAENYISPSWYASKREHGKVVPTWNYVTVHAYGAPRVVHDADWLRTLVAGLTDRHEAGRADRWQLEDAPADYVEKMLGAIVGVEIPVTRMIGKWKLSQNRSSADREGVIAGLEQESAPADSDMAVLVRRTL
jgi:transcriptional regulator